MATTLTDQIREAVKNSELSCYRICQETGIDKASMSRFLSGERGLSLAHLDKVAALLGLRITASERTVEMASVFKPAGKSEYYIVYTDENGKRRKKQGYTDKRETQELAVKLEKEARKIRNGEIDPKEQAYVGHGKMPIHDHLEDFQKSIRGKGATEKHVHMVNQRARRLLDLAKVKRISDLSLSKALEALQALREAGLSQQSINHHVRAVKGFSRWLWSDGRRGSIIWPI